MARRRAGILESVSCNSSLSGNSCVKVKDMAQLSVSVIVPVYNAEKALPRLMASLRGQSYPRDRVEIILVDNNSTDHSGEVIKRWPDVIKLEFIPWQSSYAARNIGIERATGEVLAFIDADCWAHPDWLRAGVRALQEKRLDRVAGRVEFVLSQRPNIYEVFDSSLNFRQDDFAARGWSGAGNLFARRQLFKEVGLFDEAVISQGDCEFGLRATRAGKSLGYAPDAVIYHRARATLSALVRKWIRTEYGAAQVYRGAGDLELHLWYKKANYRPLIGAWRAFPAQVRENAHLRFAMDAIANVLRLAGNLGNFLGYFGIGRGRKLRRLRK